MTKPDLKDVSLPSAVDFKQADSARNVFNLTLTVGVKAEHLLWPEFWSDVARFMQVRDKVEVVAADCSWYAEMIVLEIGVDGHGGARLAFTHGPVELVNNDQIAPPAEFEIHWGGSDNKYQVSKKGGGTILKKNLPSKESAEKWVASHKRAMAA